MFSFIVIGCAPGFPEPHLACSSYLVRQNNRLLLFDSGDGVCSALRRCKIDPLRIGTIFISHLHSDHWSGLPLLIQMNYLLERRERLDIFVPAEAVTGIRRLLDMTYLFPHKLGFDIELHKITKSLRFEMTNLEVTPYPNNHLSGHAKYLKTARLPNKMESYSFTIESGDHRIVYSADLANLEEIIPIIHGVDLLVLDGMHTDISSLGEVALANQIGKIMLTHIPEDFDFKKVRDLISRQGFKGILQAKEGLEVVIYS